VVTGPTDRATATFGGTAATSFVWILPQITAVAPAHAAGLAEVVVTTIGGDSPIAGTERLHHMRPPSPV
jgi:hypothetical protein